MDNYIETNKYGHQNCRNKYFLDTDRLITNDYLFCTFNQILRMIVDMSKQILYIYISILFS